MVQTFVFDYSSEETDQMGIRSYVPTKIAFVSLSFSLSVRAPNLPPNVTIPWLQQHAQILYYAIDN